MLSNWDEITLQDILSISTTKVDSENVSLDSYISTDNMLPDFGGVTNPEKMPSVKKVTAYEEGDILFSNIRTYFKKLWFADKSGGCSNDVIVFNVKKGVCPKFAFYSLMSESFIQYTVQTSKGTKMPRGDKVAMKQYSLLLPPLPEQKAIAHILGTLDDKIELNRQMNETLEAMAQALFKSWFVDFDPVIDNALLAGKSIPEPLKERAELRQTQLELGSGKAKTSSEINDLFPSEFEFTEELGWIPKGWSAQSINKLVDSVSITYPLKTVNKVIFLNTGDIQNGQFLHSDYSTVDGLPGQAKKSIRMHDILYSEIRPKNKRFAYVNFEADEYVVSTKLMVLRAIGDVKSIFTYFFLKQDYIVSTLQHMAESRSGTFPQITFDVLSQLAVVLPVDLKLVNYFTENILEPFFERINHNEQEANTIAKLRDTLLPKLMSGELRIADAEKLVADI